MHTHSLGPDLRLFVREGGPVVDIFANRLLRGMSGGGHDHRDMLT